MQVGPIGNHIANVNADAEADDPIRRLISIVDRNLLLHLHGTTHCPVNAVEHDQQGIAAGLDDPAAMLLYRWVNQVAAQSRSRSSVPASSKPIRRL